MKENKALHPLHVRALGADAVMLVANPFAHLVEQARRKRLEPIDAMFLVAVSHV